MRSRVRRPRRHHPAPRRAACPGPAIRAGYAAATGDGRDRGCTTPRSSSATPAALAELIFQDLWKVNADEPAARRPPRQRLRLEARRKVEGGDGRSGRLRALVATASLDLGVDWGDVDCVIQMGAPKGSSRCCSASAAANHRLDEPSEAIARAGQPLRISRGPRRPRRGGGGRARPPTSSAPARSTCSPSTSWRCACAAPFDQARPARRNPLRLALFRARPTRRSTASPPLRAATAATALKAYDPFKRLTQGPRWPCGASASPGSLTQHRLNAGIIVEATMLSVRFEQRPAVCGKRRGGLRRDSSPPRDTFFLRRPQPARCRADRHRSPDRGARDTRASPRAYPTYGGSAHAAVDQPRRPASAASWPSPAQWRRFPARRARLAGGAAGERSALPRPGQLLVETFPREGRHYMVAYSFEGLERAPVARACSSPAAWRRWG